VTAETGIVTDGDLTHGLGHCTCDMLRKIINSINTVFRTELMKGIKSNEIYKQKLSWYMKAEAFFNGATASGRLRVAWCV